MSHCSAYLVAGDRAKIEAGVGEPNLGALRFLDADGNVLSWWSDACCSAGLELGPEREPTVTVAALYVVGEGRAPLAP